MNCELRIRKLKLRLITTRPPELPSGSNRFGRSWLFGAVASRIWFKVKISPLQAMKAHEDVDARVHIFTATALGWLVLRSAGLTPGEIPRYSFYRGLSGPHDQSGHEGVKKNLHPSDTRDRTRAVQPVAKRLAHTSNIGLNTILHRTMKPLSP